MLVTFLGPIPIKRESDVPRPTHLIAGDRRRRVDPSRPQRERVPPHYTPAARSPTTHAHHHLTRRRCGTPRTHHCNELTHCALHTRCLAPSVLSEPVPTMHVSAVVAPVPNESIDPAIIALDDPTPMTLIAPIAPVLVANGLIDTTPAALTGTSSIVPIICASPPLIAHGPRDILGLRSDAQNPWGSIRHRHHRSHPPRTYQRLRPRPISIFAITPTTSSSSKFTASTFI